jgi:hypothetical protein
MIHYETLLKISAKSSDNNKVLEARMWTGLKGVFFLLTVMFLSACSIDSSLFGVQIAPVEIFAKSQGAEIVAGSSQYQTTTNGYQVSASAGNVYDRVSDTTTNGYKVYITVQGQMFSE